MTTTDGEWIELCREGGSVLRTALVLPAVAMALSVYAKQRIIQLFYVDGIECRTEIARELLPASPL